MSRTLILALPGLIVLGTLFAGLVTGHASARGIAEDYPPQGRFITVDGVRLHYRMSGPEEGPAVLVLHGASSNLEEPYTALSEAFADYRTVWLDRPGLGWSERPDVWWNPQREAVLIQRFLEELGIGEAIVVGHSWGAAIAARLAMDHPDHVTGLVLVAPALRAWVGDAAFYNKATHWPVLGTLVTRLVVPTIGRGRLDDGVQSAFAPEPVPENYIEDTHLPLILRASNWKANAHDMANVNDHLAAQEERYGEVGQPAVILAGPADTVVATDRHAVPVAETMADAELVLIEGAGHNLHHHHPGRVAEAVETVLHRARDGSGRVAENR